MIVGIRNDNLLATANAEPVGGVEVWGANSQLAKLAPKAREKQRHIKKMWNVGEYFFPR